MGNKTPGLAEIVFGFGKSIFCQEATSTASAVGALQKIPPE
jgi:hypothetical protein